MPKSRSAAKTVGLTIAGTVGAAVVLGLLYAVIGVWKDVEQLKLQNNFYHGREWPPLYRPNP